MKVIHLSTEDRYGAGRTAIRISDAICRQGVESDVYVLRKDIGSSGIGIRLGVYGRIKSVIDTKCDELRIAGYRERGLFNPVGGGIDLSKAEYIRSADIIHLHWVNYGVWSVQLMKYLAKLKKPVVWTLHDMWPYTGGCHCDGDCGKYSEHCGACPVLRSSNEKDVSASSLKKKCRLYSACNITFVGPSRWMTDSAGRSAVVKHSRAVCVHIANPISGSDFIPRDRDECLRLLRINTDKKIILFGAINATSDRNKGFDNLKKALAGLDRTKYLLLVFGGNIAGDFEGFETINTGFISDDLHLSLIYNVADVFVAPSFQDNFPNTVMEALCCGIPVVAFDIGGMPDMITVGENGYLARPYDTDDLAKGIEICVGRDYDTAWISSNIREKYSSEKIGKAYLELYDAILSTPPTRSSSH